MIANFSNKPLKDEKSLGKKGLLHLCFINSVLFHFKDKKEMEMSAYLAL